MRTASGSASHLFPRLTREERKACWRHRRRWQWAIGDGTVAAAAAADGGSCKRTAAGVGVAFSSAFMAQSPTWRHRLAAAACLPSLLHLLSYARRRARFGSINGYQAFGVGSRRRGSC